MSVKYVREEKKFHFENSKLKEDWQKAYPSINVETEIKKAENWADANPKKTKKDWKRFLVNWMNRAQSRAPRGPAKEKKTTYCKHCAGSGIVAIDRNAYRCVCVNSNGLSQLFIPAPKAYFLRPQKPLMDWVVEHKDHEMLLRGFGDYGWMLKKINEQKYYDVCQFFNDLFGRGKTVNYF